MNAISCVFVALAFGGLVWQSVLICDLYFQYKVTTRTRVFIPDIIDPLAVSVCVQLHNLLDYKKVFKDLGKNWTAQALEDNPVPMFSQLNVQQMFDYSLANDDVIEKVILLNSSASKAHTIDKRELVKSNTLITKYLYMGFLCYKIKFLQDEPLLLRHYVAVLKSPGMIRYIKFSKKMRKSNVIKITLGNMDTPPFQGLMVTPYIYREYNYTDKTAEYSYFVSSHYTMTKQSLESPYETKCWNYELMSLTNEVDCIETCVLNKTLDEFQKIPYTTLIKSGSNKKLLTGLDLENSGANDRFQKINRECTDKCSRPACKDFQVITATASYSKGNFTWKHVVPTQTSFDIKSRPQLTFVEFLTYLLGTISTWTGLSIISMNPVNFLTKDWRKYIPGKDKEKVHRRRRLMAKKIIKTGKVVIGNGNNVWHKSNSRTIVLNNR